MDESAVYVDHGVKGIKIDSDAIGIEIDVEHKIHNHCWYIKSVYCTR